MTTSTKQTTKLDQRELHPVSRINHLVIPPLVLLSLLILSYGLFQVFFGIAMTHDTPINQRILFLHLPAMWCAVSAYGALAFASLIYLVSLNPFADLVARNTAPIGGAFTMIALVSGSLWGRPEWGVWWIWDSRLTLLLVLMFLYIGYGSIAQVKIISAVNRKISAMIALFGAINLPIIKFSVDWWGRNHIEEATMHIDSVVLDEVSMITSLVLFAGLLCIATICVMLRVEGGFYQQKWLQMQLQSLSYYVKKRAFTH